MLPTDDAAVGRQTVRVAAVITPALPMLLPFKNVIVALAVLKT
jgi:hypothetical protein